MRLRGGAGLEVGDVPDAEDERLQSTIDCCLSHWWADWSSWIARYNETLGAVPADVATESDAGMHKVMQMIRDGVR